MIEVGRSKNFRRVSFMSEYYNATESKAVENNNEACIGDSAIYRNTCFQSKEIAVRV